MDNRTINRIAFSLAAAGWGTFAVLQLTLPGHTTSLPWFAVDVALATLMAVLAVKS